MGEEPSPPCPECLGTLALEEPEGGMGMLCPGCLAWMGRGSEPSSPQRAARGCPKSALLQPEPACPGAWAAADGLCCRAKGQGSHLLLLLLLLLLLVPPAAKGKRAKAHQCRSPGQRSHSLPCPAFSAVLGDAAAQARSRSCKCGSSWQALRAAVSRGVACPKPCPALFQAVDSSRGSLSLQNCIQWLWPSRCPCSSR